MERRHSRFFSGEETSPSALLGVRFDPATPSRLLVMASVSPPLFNALRLSFVCTPLRCESIREGNINKKGINKMRREGGSDTSARAATVALLGIGEGLEVE